MPRGSTVADAEVVEAPGCVPGVSGFESRRSPHSPVVQIGENVGLLLRMLEVRVLPGELT